MNIEARLSQLIGPVGGRLHTARSRNDQIALDLRLYAKEVIVETVAALRARMAAHIAKRERQTRTTNPMLTQGDWHGHEGVGAFTSSEQAYNTLHLGDASTARRLQAESRK